eukprot:4330252-Prymnesium_polylepis.1
MRRASPTCAPRSPSTRRSRRTRATRATPHARSVSLHTAHRTRARSPHTRRPHRAPLAAAAAAPLHSPDPHPPFAAPLPHAQDDGPHGRAAQARALAPPAVSELAARHGQ